MKLIQCVPNFSEGRDKVKISAIVESIRAVKGVVVVDIEMDASHNRSVVTFLGGPGPVAEAAFQGTKKAMELIDMRAHKGEHPRMGATDVVPFTPILEATMQECVALAHQVGKRIAEELKIPVYVYDRAALRPERSNLAAVRKGEYETILKEIETVPERKPDFGEARMNLTAGATAVGAREHIINFNVNFKSDNMAAAKNIAKAIRTSSGGLLSLRAKEIELSDKHCAQVSTVLTNYRETDLMSAFLAIEAGAQKEGIVIAESELIGMVPVRALVDFAIKVLKVTSFNPENQLLELKLLELLASHRTGGGQAESWLDGSQNLCEALASEAPVPGGGSASAVMAAMGSALVLKVLRIQIKKSVKSNADPEIQKKLNVVAQETEKFMGRFLDLARKDSQAYESVVTAYKVDKTHADRVEIIKLAIESAALVPLELFGEVLEFVRLTYPQKKLISASVLSDFNVGFHALFAGCLGAKENVLINLNGMKDERFISQTKDKLESLEIGLKAFITTSS